jgi:2,4-dienoyl-CoA reductase-like NADH-dependent reductase (Old Yellow Enzyme family)
MLSGKATLYLNGMFTDSHAEDLKRTIDQIHSYGSKIIFNVCHSGIYVLSEINTTPKGVSPILPGSK